MSDVYVCCLQSATLQRCAKVWPALSSTLEKYRVRCVNRVNLHYLTSHVLQHDHCTCAHCSVYTEVIYVVQACYLRCSELNFWVGLNLPQSFVEAFPLVGLCILLFVWQVWKNIFWAKKCSV